MNDETHVESSDRKERLLLVLHSHSFILWREVFSALVIALAPIVIWHVSLGAGIFPKDEPLVQVISSLLTYVWLLTVWIEFSILWTKRHLNVWMVSSRRIINVHYVGFFGRVLEAWTFDKVDGIAVANNGFLQSLFHFGQVIIQLTGRGEARYITIADVPHPEHVQRIILEQQSHYMELEHVNQEQEDLIHFVSHETKGYLAKNKAAFAAIVEGDYGNVPVALQTMAGNALTDTERGVETVMSMLKKDTAERGDFSADSRIDLRKMVLDEAEMLRPQAEKKGLSLELIIPAEEFTIVGNEAQLRGQVVRNLIDNAVRYTPSGSIQIELSRADSRTRLIIKDTGVGITADDMRRLFTKGGHGVASQAINPESTGYGLAAAKVVVEAHGGRIWAESEGEGMGSQFYVEFPVN